MHAAKSWTPAFAGMTGTRWGDPRKRIWLFHGGPRSRRTIAYYSNGEKQIPRAILLACKGWEADQVA
jgi:hypothetical protein